MERELAALSCSLQLAALSDDADERLLPGGIAFATVAAYRVLCMSGVGLLGFPRLPLLSQR
jgi:hypothetical protein